MNQKLVVLILIVILILVILWFRRHSRPSIQYEDQPSPCPKPCPPSSCSRPIVNDASVTSQQPYGSGLGAVGGSGSLYAFFNTVIRSQTVTGDISQGGVFATYDSGYALGLTAFYAIQNGLHLTDSADLIRTGNVYDIDSTVNYLADVGSTNLPSRLCQRTPDPATSGFNMNLYAVSKWSTPINVILTGSAPLPNVANSLLVSWDSIVGAEEYVVDVSVTVIVYNNDISASVTTVLHYGIITSLTSVTIDTPDGDTWDSFVSQVANVRGYKLCDRSEPLTICYGEAYIP